MRTALRPLATLLLGVSVATCSDAPNAPVKSAAGKSRFALAPRFTPRATAVYAQRATFAAVLFDHVRIQLVRPPNEIVKDTTITFDPNSPPTTIDLTIEAKSVGEVFDGTIDYTNNGQVVFRGRAKVQSHAPDENAPAQEITVDYVGVGANAARVVVTPATATLMAPSSMTFGVQVFDSAGRPLADVPIVWSSSDPTVASVAGNGALQALAKRGTTTITASTLTRISGSATLSVTLPPAGIVLISGGGQTGKAGTTLAASAVVRVVASDGVGVPGAVVNFAGPVGGGVGSPSATADASGNASSTLRLGGVLGPQSFAASAVGFSVSILATATAGDPASLLIVSGDAQQDSVKRALKPFVVKVSDSFGNPVSGATVTWARSSGAGTLSATSTQTTSDGTASVGYTLGSTTGKETVVASVTGVANGATFTADAIATAPAVVTIASGGGQSGRVAQPLAVPFVVKVTDALNNPAANATVVWTATNGTIAPSTTTDAQGLATNTLTLGSAVGTATVTATIANGTSVTFTATVQVGTVSRIAFKVSPTGGAAGSVFTPVLIEFQDAGGNVVPATNSVSIALGVNPGGSTLTGTLTRNAVAGVATFDDLIVNRPGNGYTLVASSAGVASQTSVAFNVTTGAANNLVIAVAPSVTAQSGIVFAAQPVIQLRDANNNAVPQAGVTVTASLASGSGTLNGTVSTTTNAAGQATFTNLRINGVVGAFTLAFNAPSLTGATSASIALSPGTPSVLTFVQQPTTAVAGANIAPSPTVSIRDADANQTTATTALTIAITAGTGAAGAVLSGTTTVAAVNGLATFAGLNINLAAIGYRFTATGTALTAATSGLFDINAGAPATFAILSGNNQYFPNNGSVTPALQQVIIRDALTNPVSNVPVTFVAGSGGTVNNAASIVINTNAAGIAGVSTGVTASAGVATVTVTAASLPTLTLTATRVAQGPWHSACARTTANAVYCWGDNQFGTVGNGTQTFATAPSAVVGGLTFPILAESHGGHRCGLTAAGTAYCWGQNDFGQIGDNSQSNRSAPVQVAGGHAFIAIAASSYSTCGLTTSQMYCWGWTGSGAILGDGDAGTIRLVPTLVNTGGRVFTRLALAEDYTCGVEASGVTSCWGQTPFGSVAVATPAPGAPAFTSISSGFYQTCGLTAAGAAFCMGSSNSFGQIGNGTTNPASSPVQVGGALTFAEIRAHAYNTCARTTANVLYCWGDNGTYSPGKVGDGTTTDRLSPTLVLGGIPIAKLLGGGIVATCAQATSGQPFCWGVSGYLGDTITTNNLVPSPTRWVQGTAGVATSILIQSGNNGTGSAGTPIGALPTVIVRDFANNPVANATVTFTVTGGGGSITGGTVQTNASGQATVGSWTLGATPGVNTMTATIAGVGTVIFTATGT